MHYSELTSNLAENIMQYFIIKCDLNLLLPKIYNLSNGNLVVAFSISDVCFRICFKRHL